MIRVLIVIFIIIALFVRLYLCTTIAVDVGHVNDRVGQDFVFISGNESEHDELVLYDEKIIIPKNLVAGKEGWFRVVGRYEYMSANFILLEKRLMISSLIPYTPSKFSLSDIQRNVSVNLLFLQSRIKSEYFDFLSKIFPLEFASLMTSMALGREGAPENRELKDAMRLSGLSHVLAVSGMHINFVFYGLFRLLSQLSHISEK